MHTTFLCWSVHLVVFVGISRHFRYFFILVTLLASSNFSWEWKVRYLRNCHVKPSIIGRCLDTFEMGVYVWSHVGGVMVWSTINNLNHSVILTKIIYMCNVILICIYVVFFRIKTMFGSSLLPVCRGVLVIFTLFVFVCV